MVPAGKKLVPFNVSGSGSEMDVQETLPLAPPPQEQRLPEKSEFVLAEASPEKPTEVEVEMPKEEPPKKAGLPKGSVKKINTEKLDEFLNL